MRTYTIRLDDQFFELFEELSRKTRVPKSSVVKEALLLYKKELEKEEMLRNLIESAKELAKNPENLKYTTELEGTISDGLD